MSSDSAPSRGAYRRAFRAGCLLGSLAAPVLLAALFLSLHEFAGQREWTDWAPSLPQFADNFAPDATRRIVLPAIDPASPTAALLPNPPPTSTAPFYLGEDLARVPEVTLEAVPQLSTNEWLIRKAQAAAAALYLDQKDNDGYIKALVSRRPDLAGLRFALGGACRTRGARAMMFKQAANAVRGAEAAALLEEAPRASAERQHFYQAYLAVAAQVMGEKTPSAQDAFIRALASIPRPEATQALAHVAVFSPYDTARAAALEALAMRRPEDATTALVAGLSYPWPPVAANAARAIAQLKRRDLIPQLKAALRASDPRGPMTEVVNGRKETVAHELVRVNHLRNCLLCHAPAARAQTGPETLVAEVPVPTLPLPDTSRGYLESDGESVSNLLVRIDVTYLRPDFSALQQGTDWTADAWSTQAGADANTMPGQRDQKRNGNQRFDFLVRRRVLTPAETADLRARLTGVSPYRRAAAQALRELIGRDFVAKTGTGAESRVCSLRK
jgi:hypothetical protein